MGAGSTIVNLREGRGHGAEVVTFAAPRTEESVLGVIEPRLS